MMKELFFLVLLSLFVISLGCTQHKVEVAPVEIKPIHSRTGGDKTNSHYN